MTDDATAAVRSLGGVATTTQLRDRGVHPDALHRAVRLHGTLVRPSRGIYALPTTPEPVLRALSAGGRLAGLSAAERFIASRWSCVRQCIRILPFDGAVAVLDSARHQDREGVATPLDLAQLRNHLPRRLHPVIDASDDRAASGAESIARIRLRRAGLRVSPQYWVSDGIRVDLLVDDRLVVEIGSMQFHANPDAYERDHARAAIIVGLGFDLLEFTTRQVMNDWATVETLILERARPTFSQRS